MSCPPEGCARLPWESGGYGGCRGPKGGRSPALRYRIPNACILVLLGIAAAHAATQGSFAVLGIKEALAVFLPGCLLFYGKALGGGDVKLATACMLLLPGRLWSFLIVMSVLGGLLAVAYLVCRLCTRRTSRYLPYGVAIAGAALLEFCGLTMV